MTSQRGDAPESPEEIIDRNLRLSDPGRSESWREYNARLAQAMKDACEELRGQR